MTSHSDSRHARRFGRGSAAWLVLLGLAAGCHTPPPAAHLAGCGHGPDCPRDMVFVCQSLRDTVVEASFHPPGETRAPEGDLPQGPDPPLRAANIQLYPDGPEALAVLQDLIDHAARRIDVIMNEWDNDFVGREVARRLAARAGPDLPVRVLMDGGGNLLYGQPKQASVAEVNGVVCWLARQPYVQLIRARTPCGRIDHRKLFIVDGGQVVWGGGRNIAQHYFFEWRDLSFTVSGPLAAEIQDVFESSWREQGGPPAAPPDPPAVEAASPPVNAWGSVIETTRSDKEVAGAVYRALDGARHHVYVENPYLCDCRFLRKLAEAGRRGADVRVITTIHSDSTSIDRANHVIVNRLLRAGVRVYLYPGMTHVKAAAVDGSWGYLGSANFDRLSLRTNRELSLAIAGGPLVGELEERVFQGCFRPEWEVKEPLPVSACDYLFEFLAIPLL